MNRLFGWLLPASLLCVMLLPVSVQAQAPPGAAAHFVLHKAQDSNDTGHTAISYLIPKDWKAADKIVWDVTNRNQSLFISIGATSPDGKFAIHWTNMASNRFSHLGNQGVRGVDPPEHPSDLAVQVFKNTHPGIAVDSVEPEETPTQSMFKESASSKSRALDVKVKIYYKLNGVPMLSKSGFRFDSYTTGNKPEFAAGGWSISNISTVSSPVDAAPRAMQLAAVSLSSRSWDPQFFEKYREVVQMMLDELNKENNERLKAQFDAMQSHYHDLRESNMQAFKDQMAAKDKSTRNFCDYVLDRQRMTDGHTEFILPSGFSHAYSDGDEILMTDSPNVRTGGTLTELQKVQ